MSKSWSSEVSDRESVPFFRYGPYRPFCAVISTPSASSPTTRGSDISLRASARVTVSRDMVLKSEAVRGFTAFLPVFGVPSGSTSVTYGP
ncbi:hypothetical protein SBADM41S_00940 [Streptomyces badius]